MRRLLSSWRHLPEKQIEELFSRLVILSQLRKCETLVKQEVDQMPVKLDVRKTFIYKMARKGGLEESHAEGQEIGLVQGQTKALARVIQRRFDKRLSPSLKKRLDSATIEQLDLWLDRAIVASSYDEIFVA